MYDIQGENSFSLLQAGPPFKEDSSYIELKFYLEFFFKPHLPRWVKVI